MASHDYTPTLLRSALLEYCMSPFMLALATRSAQHRGCVMCQMVEGDTESTLMGLVY